MQIIEFIDFECPFCKELAIQYEQLRTERPALVSLTLRHFPIPGHKFANVAAAAYECARDPKHMEAMYSHVLELQDSLGLRPLANYAMHVGIRDTAAFTKCLADSSVARRVSRDQILGEEIGVNATPMVVINGWLLAEPPSAKEMLSIVDAIVGGKDWRPQRGDTLSIKLASSP